MANFSITNSSAGSAAGNGQAACATSYKTQIAVHNASLTNNFVNFSSLASALRKGKLYDLLVGTNGTPADNYMEWDVIRITGGASTPTNLAGISTVSTSWYTDATDAGGGTPQQAVINASLETQWTGGPEVFYIGVNQRASYRWVAAPGSELVWAANGSATNYNGLAGRVRSGAYVGTATMQWLWTEN